MKVQAYTSFTAILAITVASPRPEGKPSTIFTAAKIHEDYVARVRACLKEYKHLEAAWPVEGRLATYFPKHEGLPIYKLRMLMPAGAPRDIDTDFNLEIMRIRYQVEFDLLDRAFAIAEPSADALEHAMEAAVRALFIASSIPDVFIPGDRGVRNTEAGEEEEATANRTEIDIICEIGTATNRRPVEIPIPTS